MSSDIAVCVIVVLFIIYIGWPLVFGSPLTGECRGYATSGTDQVSAGGSGGEDVNYNDYLQDVALDPAIKTQHNDWINNMQINLQPRMNSIRDDCDDGETPRWGLLKKDYSNVINEDQNISVPSGRTCTEGDGGNSRFGGYGIGLCPVQRKI